MFCKRTVLMQGDDWSLDLCYLTPKVALEWLEHVMGLKLQECPLSNRMWEGKKTRLRRDVEFYATGKTNYLISKRAFPAVQVTSTQKAMIDAVNIERSECYNAMIINRYNDGSQSIGPHCDDPNNLGKHGVCTLSFGETRICRFRKRVEDGVGDVVLDVPCTHGSMLSMVGKFQDFHTHEIF